MKRFTVNASIALTIGLGLTLVLLGILGGRSMSAIAAPRAELPSGVIDSHIEAPIAPAAELHVCPSGCAYSSVQAAVDAANDGDVVKVAAGTYNDMDVRPRNDVTTTGVVTQVVYISKTVTIGGGYTTTNWTTPHPITQPTTMDAQGQGRVLYITGDINPTVEGLRITGGDADGLRGTPWADTGGGVYVITATATIRDNQVFSNTADLGGGLYLYQSTATLSDNVVTANTATWEGGGLELMFSAATLSSNVVTTNTADYGGGLYLYQSTATLGGNTITANIADYGGGLSLDRSAATLSSNTISGNTADYGGGLQLIVYSDATLTNNVVAGNQASTAGSGLYISGSSPRLLHTTIVRNTGGDGSGVHVTGFLWHGTFYSSSVAMTNTLLVSHTVGINVTGNNTVAINGVLWYGTPITVSQSTTAAVTVRNQYDGDPAFAADDYHLTAGSAAIDRGLDAGVSADIDGETRPDGCFPDIGVDEFITGVECKRVYLPLVLQNH